MPDVDRPASNLPVRRAPRVIGRRVNGEMVLVRIPSLETRVLNELGGRVWDLADGRTVEEIARVLASEASVPALGITEDVRAFVAALVTEELLRIDGEAL